MNYEALGMRIRDERKNQHLTQSKLAGELGLSVSFLGHVERGSRKASIETIIALAVALRLTPNDLLQDSFCVPNRVPSIVKTCANEIRLQLDKIEHMMSL